MTNSEQGPFPIWTISVSFCSRLICKDGEGGDCENVFLVKVVIKNRIVTLILITLTKVGGNTSINYTYT